MARKQVLAPPMVQNSRSLPNLEVHLLGRRITCMTAPAIVKAIHRACIEQRKIKVAHYNVHGFNLSMQLPWFYDFLQSADIVHCDGTGILKALQIIGVKLPLDYRVSYTVLMPILLEHCNKNRLSLFLLGSRSDHLEKAIDSVQATYPNIQVSGRDGYFSLQDRAQNEAIVDQINRMKPNILLVGMGMPRQEKWVNEYGDRLQVNAILTCGAMIDRLAGVVSDCPPVLSNVGLEWVYRLAKEPRRLAARYLLGNPAFLLQILLAKILVRPNEVLEIEPKDVAVQQS